MRNKFWICDCCADKPADGKVVDMAEALVLMRQRISFRPMIFCAPNYQSAYKAAKGLARQFFPAEDGWINHNVQGLTELDPVGTVQNLLNLQALTAADLKALLGGRRE